jgi:hypothetical protein
MKIDKEPEIMGLRLVACISLRAVGTYRLLLYKDSPTVCSPQCTMCSVYCAVRRLQCVVLIVEDQELISASTTSVLN